MMPPNPTRGDRPSWAAAIGIAIGEVAGILAVLAALAVLTGVAFWGLLIVLRTASRVVCSSERLASTIGWCLNGLFSPAGLLCVAVVVFGAWIGNTARQIRNEELD